MGQGSIKDYSEERMDICRSCEYLTPIKVCMKCGCIIPIKVKIANSECPIKKWEKQQ